MSALTDTYRSRQKVLGFPVDLIDQSGALSVMEAAWNNKKSLHVVTLNAEMVIASQSDQELDRIVRHAHLIVPDGAGVVWALRLAGHQCDRLPGIELAEAALELAARNGKRVSLLGGKPEVMERLKAVLLERNPQLNLVAGNNGYFGPDDEESIVAELAASAPDLLLVALGVPKQEYFLDKWQTNFPQTVMIGVGGSFDVWTGSVKRAPAAFRRMHLEWLYRLLKEPWRYKRMGASLPSFALQVLGELAAKKLDKKDGHGGKRGSSRITRPGHDKSKERSKDK
jgi:N-acetylglucosaminyldiphosphoundecaprenol N-acetyl-beta-D-mannosaminyltransferase